MAFSHCATAGLITSVVAPTNRPKGPNCRLRENDGPKEDILPGTPRDLLDPTGEAAVGIIASESSGTGGATPGRVCGHARSPPSLQLGAGKHTPTPSLPQPRGARSGREAEISVRRPYLLSPEPLMLSVRTAALAASSGTELCVRVWL